MNLRRSFKRWLYGQAPGFRGSFPYFGTQVKFPPRSLIFELACAQGIYEADNLRLLQAALRPQTTVFDIGANIGLMSIPLLAQDATVRVVSFEPSPAVAPWLARTIAGSSYGARWQHRAVALGRTPGEAEFFSSPQDAGAYDGLRPTGRTAGVSVTRVPVATLDSIWRELGSPDVSVCKLDVEGAETEVLAGARECLRATRPTILLEWNPVNLTAFKVDPVSLLDLADANGYAVFAAPHLVPVTTARLLTLHCAHTETFVLLPR
jgi:FkbM family methyltransferase